MAPFFRQRISYEKDEQNMSLTSLCVHSSSPISDARLRLTIFDDDHDLLGCPV
jgi:hypothetical protein